LQASSWGTKKQKKSSHRAFCAYLWNRREGAQGNLFKLVALRRGIRINNKTMLEIAVHKIRGHCPVYEEGDKIVIDDPEIVLEETNALCTHALSTLLYIPAVR